MGLDTTHDCFHGPYTRFHRFRNAIGVAAGYDLTLVTLGVNVVALPWDAVDEVSVIEGYWKPNAQIPDILYVLLMHSDCDGFIMPRHCEPLANRLEELQLDEEYQYDMQQLIQGLRNAAENEEFVQFH